MTGKGATDHGCYLTHYKQSINNWQGATDQSCTLSVVFLSRCKNRTPGFCCAGFPALLKSGLLLKRPGTGRAVTGNKAIEIYRPVSFRKFDIHFIRQAFYFPALQAAEMKMIMMMLLLTTVYTKGKVIFSIISQYLMNNTIITKTVQRPVNSCPVHRISQLLLQNILAYGSLCIL